MEDNVNFSGIVREYANIRKSGRNFQGANFDEVHLHSRHFTPLNQVSQPNLLSKSTEQEVAVENGQAGPELKSSKRLENDVEVSIVTGYCNDLQNKEMNFELAHGLGKVKIQARKGKQKVTASKVEVSMSSSSGNGAKATVQTEATEKTQTFLTKVYPKGRVLFHDGTGSVSTQHMLQELLDRGSPRMAGFQQDESGIYWLMEGVCVMNVGVKHAHNWTSGN